jgi:hypothetical protein
VRACASSRADSPSERAVVPRLFPLSVGPSGCLPLSIVAYRPSCPFARAASIIARSRTASRARAYHGRTGSSDERASSGVIGQPAGEHHRASAMPSRIVMPLLLPRPLSLRRFAALLHRLSRLLLLLIILVVLSCGCRIHTSAASDHEGSYSILSGTSQAAVRTISSLQPPAVVERTHSTLSEAPAASAATVAPPAAADGRPPGTAAGASSEGQS